MAAQSSISWRKTLLLALSLAVMVVGIGESVLASSDAVFYGALGLILLGIVALVVGF